MTLRIPTAAAGVSSDTATEREAKRAKGDFDRSPRSSEADFVVISPLSDSGLVTQRHRSEALASECGPQFRLRPTRVNRSRRANQPRRRLVSQRQRPFWIHSWFTQYCASFLVLV